MLLGIIGRHGSFEDWPLSLVPQLVQKLFPGEFSLPQDLDSREGAIGNRRKSSRRLRRSPYSAGKMWSS